MYNIIFDEAKTTMKKTHEEFVAEVAAKYPSIQVLTSYQGAHRNVELGCSQGHRWFASPTNLLSKGTRSKCRECKGLKSKSITWTSTEIAELRVLAEEGATTADLVDYFGTTKASIDNACSTNGISRDRFTMKGAKTVRRICDEIGYTITKEGNSIRSNFSYICNNGHQHTQNVGNFITGSRCPKCTRTTSTEELELRAFIVEQYPEWVEFGDRTILEGKELDIVIPDLGIAIEFNGTWWHKENSVGKYYHYDKTDTVNAFGYRLIHINEDEWIYKQDIVKSRLKSLLGSSDRKIYARKCSISAIPFPREFLNINHLQGAGSSTSINLGLYLDNELVAVMTFGRPRFNTNYDYELVRYCSLLNTNVIGGASKLLKHFLANYKGSIISYSDRRWSDGNLYKKLGFTYSHTSEPNYRYYKRLNSLSRYECQKAKLKIKFPESYDDNLTEKQIMELEGYHPVYDSGNDVWILSNPAI